MSVDLSGIIGVREELRPVLEVVRRLMSKYPEAYWGALDERDEFPDAFLKEFFELGLGGALIPEEYGGGGFGVKDASLILREINLGGGNAYFVHGHYYNLALLARCARRELKEKYFPRIAKEGERVLSLALTEPEAGSDITRIKTFAEKVGDRYVISGHKIFISRVDRTDYAVLVARTKRYEEVDKKSLGITLFLVDLRDAGGSVETRKIRTMANTDAHEVYINNLEVSEANVIGGPDTGFKSLLEGLNAERIMIGAELLGNGEWFLRRAVEYAKTRVVFGRPIGQNQGVQFPLAEAYVRLVSSALAVKHAAELYDSGADGRTVGTQANIAKHLSYEAAWFAGNTAMDVLGGYGYSKAAGVERKLRETRLFGVAPISKNMILADIAHHTLGLPRSF